MNKFCIIRDDYTKLYCGKPIIHGDAEPSDFVIVTNKLRHGFKYFDNYRNQWFKTPEECDEELCSDCIESPEFQLDLLRFVCNTNQ